MQTLIYIRSEEKNRRKKERKKKTEALQIKSAAPGKAFPALAMSRQGGVSTQVAGRAFRRCVAECI